MSSCVIGCSVMPSSHVDDDAYGDEYDSDDDTNWDTRFPSWSCVIWRVAPFWLEAAKSRNVLRPTGSWAWLGNGWAMLRPSLMMSTECGFACAFASTMISSAEKYPCEGRTISSPFLACAETWKWRRSLFLSIIDSSFCRYAPWFRYPTSPVQRKFSFVNLQYFLSDARKFPSNLPGKKDPFVMQFHVTQIIDEEKWIWGERSNEWNDRWMKNSYQSRGSVACRSWWRHARRIRRSHWFLVTRFVRAAHARTMPSATLEMPGDVLDLV